MPSKLTPNPWLCILIDLSLVLPHSAKRHRQGYLRQILEMNPQYMHSSSELETVNIASESFSISH
jgi:hypothetical protein